MEESIKKETQPLLNNKEPLLDNKGRAYALGEIIAV